ncbi:late secretory pathway protein AVL9 homolog isoform X2 [Haliotis asinina]|uniref:late secretory pathway protein AVL9 homolog isoform X2 n=1 Tax=Haliotis asinina TaxID=109174 RepID=UPI003532691C
MADSKVAEDSPILHVVVIGFHHKKGCQVEYSYPPLIPGNAVDSHDVPERWKHLPSLALPDGAHNYVKDTVFFHLPSQDGGRKTVYCVSCYRQMDAKDLINKTADVTRSTVQKSVCVLSRLPLYGLIKAKLELITHAYFDERDFSKVELLQQTFNNLSQSMTDSLLDGSQVFLGLSARDVVMKFKHKIVVLFKLLLLERKVLFFGSPVENLSSTLLSVLSLFPNMVEFGLDESVMKQFRELSPTLGMASLDSEVDENESFLEVRYSSEKDVKNMSDITMHMMSEPIKRSNSVEPQSPTIPRDGSLVLEGTLCDNDRDIQSSFHGQVQSLDGQRSKALKNSENQQLKLAVDRDQVKSSKPIRCSSGDEHPKVHGHAKVHDLSKLHDLSKGHNLSKHKGDGEGLSKDDPSDLCDIQESLRDEETFTAFGSPKDKSAIVYSKEDSPLQHMPSITQIEAVQTGITMPNSSEKMEEYSREVELASSPESPTPDLSRDLPLSVDDKESVLALRKTDSFEDLDSPESISRIDREDCFSWEDDRVLLSIEHEPDIKDGVDPKGDNSANGVSASASATGLMVEKECSSDEKISVSDSDKGTSPSDKTVTHRSGRHGSPGARAAALKHKLTAAFGNLHIKGKGKTPGQIEMTPMSREESLIQQDDYGFPLAVFTKGSVCHPYLSLQYHDILQDVNIRSFVIGATNILFKQRRSLIDVIVEIADGKVEIMDKELQRLLHLTTADLRFADYLVKMVVEDKNDIYLDGTEWEGGDEWIRAQFRLYLQTLLASIISDDTKLLDDYGTSFVQAWKMTHNFRVWSKTDHTGLKEFPPGHPYQGHLNVADLRVRLSHNLQNTERGKKINAAVVQTGKYMVQTGKAVGGAISNARSALSSWFSGFSSEKSQMSPSQSAETVSEPESS